jgi:hypothetical protein
MNQCMEQAAAHNSTVETYACLDATMAPRAAAVRPAGADVCLSVPCVMSAWPAALGHSWTRLAVSHARRVRTHPLHGIIVARGDGNGAARRGQVIWTSAGGRDGGRFDAK